jgi:hypothetical protein
MAEAGRQFVGSLTEPQASRACFAFDGEAERTRWFYTPTDHGGLPLSECSSRQQQLALRLVASGLTGPAYAATTAIMSTELVLDSLEGWPYAEGWGRVRDPLRYAVSVFGAPEGTGRWGWRFGGHHVSLNYTIVDGRLASATPSFLGANPASHPLPGGGALRPLGAFEDLARELLDSLDDAQLARAVVSASAPADIVTANWPRLSERSVERGAGGLIRDTEQFPDFVAAQDRQLREREAALGMTAERREALGWTNTPKGIPAAQLMPAQREVLDALVRAYLERVPGWGVREHREGADVHFAWAGSTARGAPHYYRLQASRLLVEYDNTQDHANHVHTVWRDPDGDFGRDVLADHYARDHGDASR